MATPSVRSNNSSTPLSAPVIEIRKTLPEEIKCAIIGAAPAVPPLKVEVYDNWFGGFSYFTAKPEKWFDLINALQVSHHTRNAALDTIKECAILQRVVGSALDRASSIRLIGVPWELIQHFSTISTPAPFFYKEGEVWNANDGSMAQKLVPDVDRLDEAAINIVTTLQRYNEPSKAFHIEVTSQTTLPEWTDEEVMENVPRAVALVAVVAAGYGLAQFLPEWDPVVEVEGGMNIGILRKRLSWVVVKGGVECCEEN